VVVNAESIPPSCRQYYIGNLPVQERLAFAAVHYALDTETAHLRQPIPEDLCVQKPRLYSM